VLPLVLVLVLSAAVLVIVVDPAHPTSAFDSTTPSIDNTIDRQRSSSRSWSKDRAVIGAGFDYEHGLIDNDRRVVHGRRIAQSSGLVSSTSTSTSTILLLQARIESLGIKTKKGEYPANRILPPSYHRVLQSSFR
jgi:hypothetical protein